MSRVGAGNADHGRHLGLDTTRHAHQRQKAAGSFFMLRQDQTTFGDGSGGTEPGNCFATAVACILDLPVQDVPNFVLDYPNHYDSLDAWLKPRGLGFLMVRADLVSHWSPGSYHTIHGPGPRGLWHCVVGRNGRLVWDPHPDRTGLLEDRADDWRYGFLIHRT